MQNRLLASENEQITAFPVCLSEISRPSRVRSIKMDVRMGYVFADTQIIFELCTSSRNRQEIKHVFHSQGGSINHITIQ